MHDLRIAKIRSHRRNIQRYSRLLSTELTELERGYLHKRIAEEQAELERWTPHVNQKTPHQTSSPSKPEPSASPSTTDP